MVRRLAAIPLLLVLLIVACTPSPPATVRVTSVSPRNAAADVSVTANVTTTFNVTIAGDTLVGAFSLSSADGPVAGNLTFNSATRTAVFTPVEDLDPGTAYTGFWATSLRSTTGGRLSSAYSWSFTTEGTAPETPAVTAVAVTPDTTALVVGESEQLTAEVAAVGGASEEVTWSSSNVSVATVNDSGLVTAVAAGSATITATSVFNTSVSGTAEVTVLAPAVRSVTVEPSTAAVATGDTLQLTATVDAVSGADDGVTWASSDEDIAAVDENGLVTTLAEGTVTITATSDFDNAVFGSAALTVSDAPAVMSVTVDPATADLELGATLQLAVAVVAAGGADDGVTWASSDETVTTVDENGLVTAIAAGAATITATSDFDDTVSGSAEITVLAPAVLSVDVAPTEATLDVGDTEQLTATVTVHSGASDAISWTSSDEDIATVDADGLVTAVAPGTATITAISDFDDTVSGSATVNVAGVTGVAVLPAASDLAIGGTVQLAADVTALHGADAAVTWSSSDETVAAVDENGLVTAVAVGAATITATSDYDTTFSDTVDVTVHAPVAVAQYHTPDLQAGDSLDLDLGVAGGLAPYTYAFTTTPPAGWPENYDDVPYDDVEDVGTLRLPPAGIEIDEDTGAVVGTTSDSGFYAFLVEVTDALGQVGYAFIELNVTP